MSIVYTELTLKNMMDVGHAKQGQIKVDEVRQMTVQAIVDTGAWAIIINDETRKKLGLLDEAMDLTINPQAEAEGFSREEE